MSKEKPTWSDLSEKQKLLGIAIGCFFFYHFMGFTYSVQKSFSSVKFSETQEQCIERVKKDKFDKFGIPFEGSDYLKYSVKCSEGTV